MKQLSVYDNDVDAKGFAKVMDAARPEPSDLTLDAKCVKSEEFNPLEVNFEDLSTCKSLCYIISSLQQHGWWSKQVHMDAGLGLKQSVYAAMKYRCFRAVCFTMYGSSGQHTTNGLL